MKTKTQKTTPLSAGIVMGFTLTLLLMLTLLTVSTTRMAEINQRLEQIVTIQNAKTELAHLMKDALRERALIMHSVTVLSDPFAQNAEFIRLNEYGGQFLQARLKLEAMELGAEEKKILAEMRGLTVKTQPLVMESVDMALAGDSATARHLIETEVLPAQRIIGLNIQRLLQIQQNDGQHAAQEAARTYQATRKLMIVLGASALFFGVAIAVFVVRHTAKQAKLLQHQAMYDNLTALPNRALFHDRVEQAILRGKRDDIVFSLMLLDLDRFKEINDKHGHFVGDLLLREVGGRLKETVRSSDTVARMGGDEYAVLLPGTETDGATVLARKILTQIARPYALDAKTLDIATSIGIAQYPQHGDDFDILMQRADVAMYSAKRSGAGYAVYVTEQDERNAEDRVLKNELQDAIETGQMVLHYQPKVEYSQGQVTGVEALVRWQHPRYGLISPDRFIKLAEEAGLIKTLTLWVLEHALRQCAELHAAGMKINMAVNLSVLNLRDSHLPEELDALLKEVGLDPKWIELEFSETAIMADTVRTMDVLARLYSMGTKLAIDDYGTGYSSLNYLKQLPLHRLKIDRSIVDGLAHDKSQEAGVRCTIDLAHQLGLRVVAEGVEDEATMASLARLGCDSAQGYHICKPLDAEALLKWLKLAENKVGRIP